jgi:tRNA-binding protein
MKPVMEEITWKDFEKVEIRVGTILEIKTFPNAKKPSYQLLVDFGPNGIRKSSAQITSHYNPGMLVNRQVIAVINFPPKQIANFFSECLVLGIYDENQEVILLNPDKAVPDGSRIG